MRYEWDERKNLSNLKKHGICFEEAQEIWKDPHSLEFYDPENSLTEDRFIRVGLNPTRGILLVIFCERENATTIRIISARKANFIERVSYEEELQFKRT